jgi:RHS repeat-associated protein
VTNSQGEVVWRGRYSTWGKLVYEHTTRHAPAGFSQPLRMQGQYDDGTTGLYYNMFRYYDADAGRYSAEDPISLAGGDNLYTYAGGNPVNKIDPIGLQDLHAGDIAEYPITPFDDSPNSPYIAFVANLLGALGELGTRLRGLGHAGTAISVWNDPSPMNRGLAGLGCIHPLLGASATAGMEQSKAFMEVLAIGEKEMTSAFTSPGIDELLGGRP